jgi:predicted nucleic acid-binding protein
VNYFDTTYLVRLYVEDPGWKPVRALAAEDKIACSIIGKAEIIAAFHRKFREKQITNKDLAILIEEFELDAKTEAIHWLPLSERVLARLMLAYKTLPPMTALRSGDAIHLATAAENHLNEIYTNDRRLLQATESFGIKGIDVIR